MEEAFVFVTPPAFSVTKDKPVLPHPQVTFNPFNDTVGAPELLIGSITVSCALTDPQHTGPFDALSSQISGTHATVTWSTTTNSFVATFSSLVVHLDGYTEYTEGKWETVDKFLRRYLVFSCAVDVAEGHRQVVFQREFPVEVVPTSSEKGVTSTFKLGI
jgi:hypothetical protein